MYQHPGLQLMDLMESDEFSYAKSDEVSDKAESNYVEFTL
jgi:hypothetical protein